MDLALYGRVLRRFWGLVAVGLTLAVVLSILSVASVSSHGLSYRSKVMWQSTTKLLLTRDGKPFAAPTVYAQLTELYSELANSDPVRRSMLKAGAGKDWKVTATPVVPTSNPYAALPVILLAGEAPTPRDALKATKLGRQAFIDYVSGLKGSAGIEVLTSATPPTVAVPRSKTLPIIVFLAMLSATFALALILENTRPARATFEYRLREPAVSEAGRDREPAVALSSHSSR
jgi:hypothetical protein